MRNCLSAYSTQAPTTDQELAVYDTLSPTIDQELAGCVQYTVTYHWSGTGWLCTIHCHLPLIRNWLCTVHEYLPLIRNWLAVYNTQSPTTDQELAVYSTLVPTTDQKLAVYSTPVPTIDQELAVCVQYKILLPSLLCLPNGHLCCLQYKYHWTHSRSQNRGGNKQLVSLHTSLSNINE